jgi:hypothetical protein
MTLAGLTSDAVETQNYLKNTILNDGEITTSPVDLTDMSGVAASLKCLAGSTPIKNS